MAGQSVGLIQDVLPMAEIIRRLVDDAEAELERVGESFDRVTR